MGARNEMAKTPTKAAAKAKGTPKKTTGGVGKRSSGRVSKPPARFPPANSSMPSELQEMIRDIASEAAAGADIRLDASAITELEATMVTLVGALEELEGKDTKQLKALIEKSFNR